MTMITKLYSMFLLLLLLLAGERSRKTTIIRSLVEASASTSREDVVQQQYHHHHNHHSDNSIELDIKGNSVMDHAATETKSNSWEDEAISSNHSTMKSSLASSSSPLASCYRNVLQETFSSSFFPASNTNHSSPTIRMILHRNGEPDPCTTNEITLSIDDMIPIMTDIFEDIMKEWNGDDTTGQYSDNCHEDKLLMDKYQMDTFLTYYFANALENNVNPHHDPDDNNDNLCGSMEQEYVSYRNNDDRNGLYEYCFMGPERTVIHNDHDNLIPIPDLQTLPCRWYTREGQMISSLSQLVSILQKKRNDEKEVNNEEMVTFSMHLYAVPAGRVFMFAPKYIGERFVLDHIQLTSAEDDDVATTTDGQTDVVDVVENARNGNHHDTTGPTIILTVLSLYPRVFDIEHFFTMTEAETLLEKALHQTISTHKFHRSTTGTTGASVFSKRTSENAWDTHGATATIIKKRCFQLLGFDTYNEAYADGLQILRYNQTNAYTPHMDYLEDKTNEEAYNYDTSKNGGNRFATILLYFNDLPEGAGGETVFPRSWAPDRPHVEIKEMIQQLRQNEEISMLQSGSWEEEMVALCRTKLSIRPKANRAVLFYSQHPNGTLDYYSYHGGCPVLNANVTKYAANLWTWSGIRPEYPGAPFKRPKPDTHVDISSQEVKAIFRNKNKDPMFHNAQLFYDETGYFGDMGTNNEPIYINTYIGHVWNIKDKYTKKILATFVIEANKPNQEFNI